MISLKEACRIFNKKQPDLTITKAALYKGRYYLLNAQIDPNKTDYSDPFYIVDKNTGEVKHFLPSSDMNGFLNAIYKHELDIW